MFAGSTLRMSFSGWQKYLQEKCHNFGQNKDRWKKFHIKVGVEITLSFKHFFCETHFVLLLYYLGSMFLR